VPERVILSWSGGKDSSMALAELCAAGRDSVAALLTTVTAEYDRVSVHGVRRELLRRQADAVGLPLEEAVIPAACTNAMYEEAFRGALMRLESSLPGVRAVAFGDLFLEDVRQYRERQFATLARPLVFPIWGRDTSELARQFITSGFEAILVCVDTQALPATFAGRPFDAALLDDLPAGVDPCGENGEFHTFVTKGPAFARPVAVERGEIVLRDDRFAYCDLIGLPNQ
jgi:uncharacterized protein (TIGR00290 family)